MTTNKMPLGFWGPLGTRQHCCDFIRLQFLRMGHNNNNSDDNDNDNNDKNHRIIGLRNLANASAAQK